MTAAFARVIVDHIVQGGTRVSWEINRNFTDPGTYTFQLQYGHTAIADPANWIDVGIEVDDTYYAFDMDKRIFGKTVDSHYRVKLTTINGTYYSNAAPADGLLSKRDWLHAREIVRKESLRHRVLTSPRGFLLKVRRYGPRCITCTDTYTEEVSKSQCTDCYGTGFDLGYFEPMSACFADIGLEKNREHRTPEIGMEKKDTIQARFIGDPQLYSYDVWVNEFSDERYYMHTIGPMAHVRGVSIIYDAELRLAPFTDIIYTLDISKASIPDPPGLTKENTWVPKKQPRQLPELTYLETVLKKMKKRKRV